MTPGTLMQYVALCSVVLSAAFTVLAWRYRDRPGARPFLALLVGVTWWVATAAAGMWTTNEQMHYLLVRLQYPGLAVVPPAWLLFALEYTGRDEYVTRGSIAAVSVVPALAVLGVWTNPEFGLMWHDRWVETVAGVAQFEGSFALGFWLFTVYSYLLLGVGATMLLMLALDSSSRYRRQAAALVLAVTIPFVMQVLYHTHPGPVPRVNLTPFAFIGSAAIGMAAVGRFGFLESDPVASQVAPDRVIERLDDAVVVLDGNRTVVDANPAAETLLGPGVVGHDAETVLPGELDLDALADGGTAGEVPTVERQLDGDPRYYDTTASALRDRRGAVTGWVVNFHDVTDRRRRERRTETLTRVLRRTLREEMDAVYSHAGEMREDDEVVADLQEHAQDALEVGTVAEEFEPLLGDSVSDPPADIVPIVGEELDRVRERHPGVDVTLDAPLGEWAYCGALFEPVFRALVNDAASRATGSDPQVAVDVRVDEGAGEVTVSVADSGPARPDSDLAVLCDGVVPTETDDSDASTLSLWLVHWGVDHLGGAVAVPEGSSRVDLRLPLVDDQQ
ncbi:histidine kinase N-terminal 7TM domain-containing protein [Haloarchaeobius amylolyticus]|uniref:histidine kinase N-terminal 7TM domain-containing protein n=1 Tax=Haloarchaeobius amylolyticus TaxID=1198296 RepID=UPI00226FAE34|nr:histidine kinase N-terminal 7TM domain-containing protein [Haloarchaeobius amylolyticus]